ncbi:MAG TPA: hypothetical protein IGR64_04590 [Leptolyngbyaceae cyanobacterium M65_K2018_010]|nr:hypothetical protein [Leptolyngbyaceae cyanobacterium M65_K2018_010]
MKKRCLPCYLIVRNVGLTLAAIAVSVLLTAEIHASANAEDPTNWAVMRLFAYKISVNADQGR